MPAYKLGTDTTKWYRSRIDPYWGDIWSVPGQETGVTWHERENLQVMVDRNIARFRSSERRWSVDEAYEKMSESRRRKLYLQVIASAYMWRTVTQEQIGAIAGWSGLIGLQRMDPHCIMVPWSAGIVQWGHPTDFSKHLRLVRPSTKVPPRFIEALSYQERLAVFGGQTAVLHGRMARHNVLNAEVSLRVAEHLSHLFPIVLGEGSAFAKILLPESKHRAPVYSVGDAVWIRQDGLRVIVETSNQASSMVTKIQRWAPTLSADANGSRSLYLLFVIPNRYSRLDWVKHTKKKLAEVVFKELGSAGYDYRYLASRVGVIEWNEWFPAYHEINNDLFQVLRVWQLNQRNEWQLTSLADPYAIECNVDPEDVATSIGYAKNLYGVPSFLRDNPRDLGEDLLYLAQRSVNERLRLKQPSSRREANGIRPQRVYAQGG
jgi:hypothetical protein